MERITKRQRTVDAAPSQSAGRIDKGAVVRKSQARTQCRKPTIALGKVLNHAKGRHKSRPAGVAPPPSHVALKSPDEAADLVIEPRLDPTYQAVRVEVAAGAAIGDAAGHEGARRKRPGRVIKAGDGIVEPDIASHVEPCPAHHLRVIC